MWLYSMRLCREKNFGDSVPDALKPHANVIGPQYW